MKVFIKTPLYRNSNYLWHLLEHCILNNEEKNLNDFFNFFYKIYWTYSWSFIELSVDNIDEKTLINYITKFISTKQIIQEKKIIAQENQNISNNTKIKYKFAKLIYWKDFWWKKFSNIEILDYFSNVINKDNILITDDNYIPLSNINSNTNKDNNPWKINKTQFTLKKESYNWIYTEFKSRKDDLTIIFLAWLIDSYYDYQYRYLNWEYYYDQSYSFYLYDYVCICRPKQQYIFIDEDFLFNYKKQFIQDIEEWKLNKTKIINYIINWDYFQNNNAKDYINEIDLLFIQSIFSQ